MLKYQPSVNQIYLRSIYPEQISFVSADHVFSSIDEHQESPEVINTASFQIDLRSSKNKAIVTTAPGPFHVIYDALTSAIEYVVTYKIDVLFDLKLVGKYFEPLVRDIVAIMNNRYESSIILFNSLDDGNFITNNYYLSSRHVMRPSSEAYKILRKIIREAYLLDSIIPSRRTYITRKNTLAMSYDMFHSRHDFPKTDTRIIDEDNLELFFAKLEYDIVSAENFGNVVEQIKYFASVKTLVAATGNGLANASFMHDKTNIVEIKIPILMRWFGSDGMQDNLAEWLHDQYSTMAFHAEQLYVSIPAQSKRSEDIIKYIKSSRFLKAIVKDAK